MFIINCPNRWDFMYKWTHAHSHTNTQEHDVAPSIHALLTQFSHVLSGESEATSQIGIHHAKSGVFRDTSLRGRVYLSMDSARRDVEWPALSPDVSPSDCMLRGFERDSRYHRLCNLVPSQPMSTDASSHSTSASRNKLHLTRHHPIHAQTPRLNM